MSAAAPRTLSLDAPRLGAAHHAELLGDLRALVGAWSTPAELAEKMKITTTWIDGVPGGVVTLGRAIYCDKAKPAKERRRLHALGVAAVALAILTQSFTLADIAPFAAALAATGAA